MKKRILALALSMCLATTLIPTAWAANKGYTINGTNVTAASPNRFQIRTFNIIKSDPFRAFFVVKGN